jgi:hypothetical protein
MRLTRPSTRPLSALPVAIAAATLALLCAAVPPAPAPAHPLRAPQRPSRSAPGRAAAAAPAPAAAAERLVEEFSFVLSDFAMTHQGEDKRLNITLRYRYVPAIKDSAYPDYQWLMRDVRGFLTGYPNEADYWEIVNKKLTRMLLERYPSLAEVTSTIEVSPTPSLPHVRASTVTRARARARTGEAAPRRQP